MGDIILILILLLAAGLALRTVLRAKKGDCGGNCGCCGGGCCGKKHTDESRSCSCRDRRD